MSVIPRARALGLIVVIALTGALAGCYSAASSSDYVVSSGSTSWSVPSAWRMTSTPPPAARRTVWHHVRLTGRHRWPLPDPKRTPGHPRGLLADCDAPPERLAGGLDSAPFAHAPASRLPVGHHPCERRSLPGIPRVSRPLWCHWRQRDTRRVRPWGGDQVGAVAMPGAEKMPACVRGPDLAAGEASVTGILVSVRLRDRLTDRGDQPHMPHNPPLTDPAATPTVEVNQRAVCRIW
jgi:hypothetical protein